MNWWLPPVDSETSVAVPAFVEVAVAAILAGATGWLCHCRPKWAARIGDRLRAVADYTRPCILVTAFFPIVVRLAVLPWLPAPEPKQPDEFSHLLVADTLSSSRLANPA